MLSCLKLFLHRISDFTLSHNHCSQLDEKKCRRLSQKCTIIVLGERSPKYRIGSQIETILFFLNIRIFLENSKNNELKYHNCSFSGYFDNRFKLMLWRTKLQPLDENRIESKVLKRRIIPVAVIYPSNNPWILPFKLIYFGNDT